MSGRDEGLLEAENVVRGVIAYYTDTFVNVPDWHKLNENEKQIWRSTLGGLDVALKAIRDRREEVKIICDICQHAHCVESGYLRCEECSCPAGPDFWESVEKKIMEQDAPPL